LLKTVGQQAGEKMDSSDLPEETLAVSQITPSQLNFEQNTDN